MWGIVAPPSYAVYLWVTFMEADNDESEQLYIIKTSFAGK